jgi:hypothetical protein
LTIRCIHICDFNNDFGEEATMASTENRKEIENDSNTTGMRFRIEKLEERIAPHHRLGHYPPGHSNDYRGYGGCWTGNRFHSPCNN